MCGFRVLGVQLQRPQEFPEEPKTCSPFARVKWNVACSPLLSSVAHLLQMLQHQPAIFQGAHTPEERNIPKS